MNDFFVRCHQAEIAPVPVDTRIVRKVVGVPADTERIVRLAEVAGAYNELAFVVALEAGARHDVEDAIGAITLTGAVAATFDFQVGDVLRIDLWAQVARDVRIGDPHAIDLPSDLVTATH